MSCRHNQNIFEYLLEWDKANNLFKKATNQTQIFLARQPPPYGLFELNIDGSRVSDSRCIDAGGIIRNSDGILIAGFSANLGHGEIIVNSDYALVVDMINGEWVDSHSMSVSLTKCREFLESQ
ncbi:unnamed protein product [Prunus armeniaca]|uniref:RNase H type-1 domain-containing protein n=1 Tax=Prunus armeniaca TaxID=36596 RepID=A0A6J5V817_PRUAR|nr:unnamed protein product [Prunus armeniaca]CAB4315979.1 unnamed protein product [Prunus armeniaca]